MELNTAERAAKSRIINERIQRCYEKLTGRLLQGDRLSRMRELPEDYLLRLADELDLANPKSGSQRLSLTVESILDEFEQACQAKCDAELNASGAVALVDMHL